MGYGVYEDFDARDYGVFRFAGYAVPAFCDWPDCRNKIDRGLGYKCESHWSNPGDYDDEYDGPEDVQEEGCGLFFCSDHGGQVAAHDEIRLTTPERKRWIRRILSHKSWAQWRSENPNRVALYREFVGLGCPECEGGVYRSPDDDFRHHMKCPRANRRNP